MSFKRTLYKKLPPGFRSQLVAIREKRRLQAIPRVPLATDHLKLPTPEWLKTVFLTESFHPQWEETVAAFSALKVPDHAGGVNPGDQRAIFYLLQDLQPRSVLEIGTHIGVSTYFIASSLNEPPEKDLSTATGKLTTVDIVDVNDPDSGPWKSYGSPMPPVELLKNSQLSDTVNFVQMPSLDFIRDTTQTYDFIFLDGDHSAATVYKEVPAALAKLNQNGIILLHDYYPHGKPLWQNGVVLPGPYFAMKRIMAETPGITVLPFGNLPWPTKHNSNASSLAIIVKQ